MEGKINALDDRGHHARCCGLLGLVCSYTLGGFIHLLLVAAIVLVAVRLIQGRSVTSGP